MAEDRDLPGWPAEMAETRQSKYAALEQLVKEQNAYLAEHPRASLAVAQAKVEAKWKKLRLPAVDVRAASATADDTTADDTKADDTIVSGRTILLSKQQEAWTESCETGWLLLPEDGPVKGGGFEGSYSRSLQGSLPSRVGVSNE